MQLSPSVVGVDNSGRYSSSFGWRRSIVVRTLVSAGELSLSCTTLLAGWVTTF